METYPYRVAAASVSCRWKCPQILAGLPFPGTPHFGELMKAFETDGVEARNITVETPSNRLSDVVLSIGILRGEIRLLLNYAGFEIAIDRLLEDHIPIVPRLAKVAVESLRDFRISSEPGEFEVSYRAHFELEPGLVRRILATYLRDTGFAQSVNPDAFAYRMRPEGRTDIKECRMVFAQSLLLKEALYVDLGIAYFGDPSAVEPGPRAVDDVFAFLGMFGLKNPPQRGAR